MARLTQPLGGYGRPGAGLYGQPVPAPAPTFGGGYNDFGGIPGPQGGPGPLPPPLGGGANSDSMGVLGAPALGRRTLPPIGQGATRYGGGGVSDFGAGTPRPPAPLGGGLRSSLRQPLGGYGRPSGNGLPPRQGDGPPSVRGGSFRQFGGPQGSPGISRLSPYYGGGTTLPPPGQGGGTLPPIGGNAPGSGSDIPGRPGGSTVSYNDFVAQGPTPGDAATGTMKGLGTGPQNIFGWDPTNPMARYGMYTDPRTGKRAKGAADIMASMSSRGWTPPGQPDFKFSFAQAQAMKDKAYSDMEAEYASGRMTEEEKIMWEDIKAGLAQDAYDAQLGPGGIGQIGARPVGPSEAFFNEYGSTGPFENPDWAANDPNQEYSTYLANNGYMRPGYKDDPYYKRWESQYGPPPPLMAGGLGGQSQAQIDASAKEYRDYMRRVNGVSPDPYDDNGNPWPDTTEADIAYYKAWCQANGKNPASPQSQAEFAAQQGR